MQMDMDIKITKAKRLKLSYPEVKGLNVKRDEGQCLLSATFINRQKEKKVTDICVT